MPTPSVVNMLHWQRAYVRSVNCPMVGAADKCEYLPERGSRLAIVTFRLLAGPSINAFMCLLVPLKVNSLSLCVLCCTVL